MDKNCDNCYWRLDDKWCLYRPNKPEENVCYEHELECQRCGCDLAEYKYMDEVLCVSCLIDELSPDEVTETHFYLDGEYLGSDNDLYGVVANLCDDRIEELEES